MINTLLSGVLTVSMTVVNWVLTPIYNLIDGINFNGTSLSDCVSLFNSFLSTISAVLSWVADATGIPPIMFTFMFGIFTICINLRLSVYIIKLVLKWWDRIVA